MRRTDKITSFVELANQAALPVVGKRGQVFELADDGSGVPALAVWDSGAAVWIITSLGGGGGGSLAWQNPVEDKDVTDPSTLTPSAGERWIVATGGVGVWSGKDDDIAEWDGVQWDFITPTEGFACEVLDEDQYYAYTGTAWVILPDFLGAVSGTPPSTDHAISRYDGITGLKIQDSPKNTIDDTGKAKIIGDVTNPNAEYLLTAFGLNDLAYQQYSYNSGIAVGAIGHLGGQLFSIQCLADARIFSNGVSGATDSKRIEIKSGSVVDGRSGDIPIRAGTPSGTGTQGDVTIGSANWSVDTSGKVGFGTPTPNAPFEVAGGLPGDVGGFPSGIAHVRNISAAENANSVLTGHNSFGGNKQLWYLGSTSSGNDDIALINRQNGNMLLSGKQINLSGGQKIKSTAVADADHTLLVSEYLIAYTSITVARTVDLPPVASLPANSVFVVKDESGSLTPTIKITIDPNLAETMDGVASIDMITPYEAVEFYTNSTATAWFTK